ncbi:MAG: DNA polymerase III subunit delta [Nitrospirae bacterium GWD2_57_9]|nr:MAG: DNA polymerase III subunit delta [Nitrospirae bacterium GWD2_57_9]OGW46157.1 MAG: DNA polymerase III subunit delta [Nitrospirae bacterium GWC2_57_9]
MLKYSDLISGLKQGKLLPVYLFFGQEEFLVQEAVDLIIAKVVEPGGGDFNFNTVYCRDTPASEIVNLCQTLPFMSAKRLVIAKDIDALRSGDLDELLPYLNDPSPSTCLVLISHQERYEKKPVVSAVDAQGAVTRFYSLLDREVPPWIEGKAKGLGLTIERDAALYLLQTIGNDLQKLLNELEKIAIYSKGKRTITYEDTKAVAGDFREYSSFDLAAAVGGKSREKAFQMLTKLLQEGEAPVGLLGSIAWNFRRLLQAKSRQQSGISLDEAIKGLRPPVIFHQTAQFKAQLNSYSLDELRRVFDVMLDTDRALKSSGLPGKLILERMILELCGT